MNRSILHGVIASGIGATLLLGALVPALAAAPASPPRLLLLHNGENAPGSSWLTARRLADLLGHFAGVPVLQPVSACEPRSLDAYAAVFLCELDAAILAEPLLTAIAQRSQPTCWLAGALDRPLAHPAALPWGLAWRGAATAPGFTHVRYRSALFPKTVPGLAHLEILDPKAATVLAVAVGPEGELPFIVRQGPFWFVAGPALSGQGDVGHGMVFADLLHDILGQAHPPQARALVRLEDVSAYSQPADLRRAADVLSRRGVPFQVAVIPVFRDPSGQQQLALSDRPAVVDALRYLVAQGGHVVVHGYTHQRTGVSGIDFEFWDPATNRPVPGTPADFRQMLQAALGECFRARLFPIAWETPHYAASPELYTAVAGVFSHAYERRWVAGTPADADSYPYVVTDRYGQQVLPENLGYLPLAQPDPAPLLAAAGRLRVLRDPVASFFFHPFMPVALLETVVDGLRHHGYTFVSAASFGCRVSAPDFAVATTPGPLPWESNQPYRQMMVQDGRGALRLQTEANTPGPLTVPDSLPRAGLAAYRGFPLAVATATPPPDTVHSVVLVSPAPPLTPDPEWHSFATLAALLGQPLTTVPADTLARTTLPGPVLWLVPQAVAAQLSPAAITLLCRRVASGEAVLVSGRSALAETLGCRFLAETVTVARARDTLAPDTELSWRVAAQAVRFQPAVPATPLATATDADVPLITHWRLGDGHVVLLSTDLDPLTGEAYARYPHLPHHLRRLLHLVPVAPTATSPEYYFDPGYRQHLAIEQVVADWDRDGVRTIHAAAWHRYPHWEYDYERLIRLCHARGIAVYAWFELPMVSDWLWTAHPEWREQTVTGRDATVGWRRLLNFADPACRTAAFAAVEALLRAHDWDGVNIAEFCFDTGAGLRDPDTYVPFNAHVRDLFHRQTGIDPRLLFAPTSSHYWKSNRQTREHWEDFRQGLLRTWLVELLDRLTALQAERPLAIVCTTLDTVLTPAVIELTGSDSRFVASLLTRYDFTLQVEDPASEWGAPPDRYAALGRAYGPLVPDRHRLMFDINVVTDRTPQQAPTLLPQGTELAVAWRHAAAAGGGRVALYSEASLLPADRQLLASLSAPDTRLTFTPTALTIENARPVHLRPDAPAVTWLRHGAATHLALDGWLLATDTNPRLLLPGFHRLTPTRGSTAAGPSLSACGGTVLDLTPAATQLHFTYRAPHATWAWLAGPHATVAVDGTALPRPQLTQLPDQRLLVPLPAGQHRVTVHAQAPAADGPLAALSRLAATAVVWGGGGGLVLLGALYAATRIRRPRRAAAPTPTPPAPQELI